MHDKEDYLSKEEYNFTTLGEISSNPGAKGFFSDEIIFSTSEEESGKKQSEEVGGRYQWKVLTSLVDVKIQTEVGANMDEKVIKV